jgi:hypothetical protein
LCPKKKIKLKKIIFLNAKNSIEISVKSGKDSTSTLSLVIHRVRLKKQPANKYISIQRGVKLRKPSIFLSFTPVFLFFLSASTAAT